MDTTAAMRIMPAHEDTNDVWRDWSNSYPTFVAAGLHCAEFGDRSARFELTETTFPLNPNGQINGGVVALAADQVMGVVAARVSPTGSIPATAVLNVQYHSPAFPPLAFESTAVPGGRSVQTVEVVILDRNGRRCVTAYGTMAVGPSTRRSAPEAS